VPRPASKAPGPQGLAFGLLGPLGPAPFQSRVTAPSTGPVDPQRRAARAKNRTPSTPSRRRGLGWPRLLDTPSRNLHPVGEGHVARPACRRHPSIEAVNGTCPSALARRGTSPGRPPREVPPRPAPPATTPLRNAISQATSSRRGAEVSRKPPPPAADSPSRHPRAPLSWPLITLSSAPPASSTRPVPVVREHVSARRFRHHHRPVCRQRPHPATRPLRPTRKTTASRKQRDRWRARTGLTPARRARRVLPQIPRLPRQQPCERHRGAGEGFLALLGDAVRSAAPPGALVEAGQQRVCRRETPPVNATSLPAGQRALPLPPPRIDAARWPRNRAATRPAPPPR